MQVFGKVTFVGTLQVIEPTENSKNQEKFYVLPIELKTFECRSSSYGPVPGVVSYALRLVGQEAQSCQLAPGEWICADVYSRSHQFPDRNGVTTVSSDLNVSRLARISDFNLLD